MNIQCRICNSSNLSVFYRIDDSHTLLKCQKCSLVQLPSKESNKLDDNANKESIIQDTFRKTSDEDLSLFPNDQLPLALQKVSHLMKGDCKRLIPLIQSLVNQDNSSFIDIGSGYGQLSFNLKESNPKLDIHLLETSSERINLGIKGFKPNINNFTFHHKLLDKKFSDNYINHFDISYCFHVLEHVYNIRDFIKNIFKITKKGGSIIIEVPNEDDDLLKLSSNYAKVVRFPAHVSSFNKFTLEYLLKSLELGNYDMDFLPVQRYGFFNYIEWLKYNDKTKVTSDDYIPRDQPSWIESCWLRQKYNNFSTDSIMMIIKKLS